MGDTIRCAFLMPIKEVLDNLNTLMELSSFDKGVNDFIVTTEKAESYICLIKTEYAYEVVKK